MTSPRRLRSSPRHCVVGSWARAQEMTSPRRLRSCCRSPARCPGGWICELPAGGQQFSSRVAIRSVREGWVRGGTQVRSVGIRQRGGRLSGTAGMLPASHRPADRRTLTRRPAPRPVCAVDRRTPPHQATRNTRPVRAPHHPTRTPPPHWHPTTALAPHHRTGTPPPHWHPTTALAPHWHPTGTLPAPHNPPPDRPRS